MMTQVLITGAPRSGKSTLCDILQQEYNLNYVSESRVKTLWNYGIFSFLRYDLIGVQEDWLLGNYPNLVKFLFQSNNSYIDASTEHIFHLRKVKSILRGAKIIVIVRDPSDVVFELANAWHSDMSRMAVKQKLYFKPSFGEFFYSAFRMCSNVIYKGLFGRKLFFGPLQVQLLCMPFKSSPLEMAIKQLELVYDEIESEFAERNTDRMQLIFFDELVDCPRATMNKVTSWLFSECMNPEWVAPDYLVKEKLNKRIKTQIDERLKDRISLLVNRHNLLKSTQ